MDSRNPPGQRAVFKGSLFHRWSIVQCLKPLQVGLVPTPLLTHIGDMQACLGDKRAGIGTPDQPGQIDERRNPNRAGIQARRQLVEELLGKLGGEPRQPPLRISAATAQSNSR